MKIQQEPDRSFFHALWGRKESALLGDKRSKPDQVTSPIFAAKNDHISGYLGEFFQPPRWEAPFLTPGKECYCTCFQLLAPRLPQWTWERQGWGFCCACSPRSTCSMHRVKMQLCREIPSNSVAFSPAGYISCFGLIKYLIEPPTAALWSQSSVSVSWALFRVETFLTPFLTQGLCQALCLSRNSHLLQHWGCHRTINKQLMLQRWCTGQKFCAGLCFGRMVMPSYQPAHTPYLIL